MSSTIRPPSETAKGLRLAREFLEAVAELEADLIASNGPEHRPTAKMSAAVQFLLGAAAEAAETGQGPAIIAGVGLGVGAHIGQTLDRHICQMGGQTMTEGYLEGVRRTLSLLEPPGPVQ